MLFGFVFQILFSRIIDKKRIDQNIDASQVSNAFMRSMLYFLQSLNVF
jgi:hypothetical protein